MDSFMRLREVKIATSLSKTLIYTLIRSGRFPRPLRLSANRVAWRLSDVQAWIAGHSAPMGDADGRHGADRASPGGRS